MGIIQKQSIRSSVAILIGFAIGAINMVLLAPKVLTTEQIGLTRVITDAGLTLATMCTFGALPVIYKFFPFYKSYLSPRENDLPFVTLCVCIVGFVVMCIAGYAAKDLLVRKYSARSPQFVQYSYLVYPFCFFMMLYMWMESFAWSFKKGVLSNTFKETIPRLLFTLLLVLFAIKLINFPEFLWVFALSYLLPLIPLFFVLRRTNEFLFNPVVSKVTNRMKGKMINFGLFLFGAQFLNLLSKTADTFILSAKASRGLTDVTVFTIATYIVTLMDIPKRSINAISIPILAESWRNKDMQNIRHIYERSVTNLLVVGLAMFILILLNIPDLKIYLGKDYAGIETVVFFMGLGQLIDLGTGANTQIIGTSSYWKVDFTTNVIGTLVALPLNYTLIAHFGLMGAAYATLIALCFYNLMRFGFLWYKFNLQPYTRKDLLVVVIALACAGVAYSIPRLTNNIIDAVIHSAVFCISFGAAIYFAKISPEINQLMVKYLQILTRGRMKK